MSANTCTDRWHSGKPFARYIIEVTDGPGDGWMGSGFKCRTCGFRTCRMLDDGDNDITDRYILESRVVTWRELLSEALAMRKLRRDIKEAAKHVCVTCGNPAETNSKFGYTCYSCVLGHLDTP